CGRTFCAIVLYLQRLRRNLRHIIWRKSATIWFLPTFGDIPFWCSLASGGVLPYISSYPCITTLMRWGHGHSVTPETASMPEGARFRLNTSHHCPDSLVTGCH